MTGAVDMVNSPPHYLRGGMETIDVIERWGLGYHEGTFIKYTLRAGHKGDTIFHELEDKKKALWFLERKKQIGGAIHIQHSDAPFDVDSVCKAFELDSYSATAVRYLHDGDLDGAIAVTRTSIAILELHCSQVYGRTTPMSTSQSLERGER